MELPATAAIGADARIVALRADLGAALADLDPDAGLARAAAAIATHLDLEFAGIWLADSDAGMTIRAAAGPLAASIARRRLPADGVFLRSLAAGRAIRGDADADILAPFGGWFPNAASGAIAAYPLRSAADRLGALVAVGRRPLAGDEPALAAAAAFLGPGVARWHGEAATARTSALLEAMLDHLPHPVWAKDAAGRYLRLNPAAAARLGLADPASAVGKTDRDLLPEPQAQTRSAAERRVLATGESSLAEAMPTADDLAGREWAVDLAPLRDDADRVVGVIGHERDATGQRRAETALRRAERRYRDLFAEAPVMYTASRLTDRGPVLSDCNRMFWSTLGYASRDEVVGRPLTEFFAPASRSAVFVEGGYAAALAGTLPAVERQLVTKDGRVIDVLVQAGPDLDGHGVARGTRAAFLDITARKRLEHDLRAAEARYRSLVECLPAVVYQLANDATHTPRYYSPRLADLIGVPVEEALTRRGHWLDEVHPDDRARVAAESARSATCGGPFRCEYRHRRADGSWLWVRDECDPERDDDGTVVAWHGVMLDVSDQHRLQDDLVAARVSAEAAERRTQDILARVADGFFAVDRGWRVTYVNEAAERLLGRERAAVLGRSIWDLVPGAADAPLAAALRRAMATGEPATVDMVVPPVDAWFEVAAYPSADGLSAFVRDVTERRGAEETRALLAAIVASADDAIVGKTLDGTVTSWNAGAERLYGWSADEMVGRSIATLVPPDRLDELADILARLRRGERVERLETVRVTRDGRRIAVSLTVSPVHDGGGRATGASVIARDVSERVRLEELRRDFLAMVTHDLRTPLTGVRGYAQLLRRRGEYRETAVDAILAEADRMQRLIDGLADVVRLEAGRLELRRAPVDLVALVRREIDAVRDRAPDRVIRIDAPPGPVVGWWDADRLGQVVQNLVGNAVRYAPDGSPVVVRVEGGEAGRLSVRDEGPGIAPEHLPRLFERFYRAGITGAGGLGLGLYITRMIVEAHGGTIAVESEPGAGSLFAVTLPAAAPPDPDESPDDGAGDAFNGS